METIGKFGKFEAPKEAELLTLSDYTTTTYREKPSVFVPKLKIEEKIERFICPMCKDSQEALEHGDAYECDCGLKLQSYGNALYIWK